MAALSRHSRGFRLTSFWRQEREKDLLRFSTAGSVDDGKSTLIGRLLYDTQSVYEDQVRSIEGKGTTAPGQIDFALAHRRPARRARAGHHHRRRLSLLLHGAAQVHHRGHAGPRAVHAQHGHRRIDRRCRRGADRRQQRRADSVAPPRLHRVAAARAHVLVAVNKMDLIGYDEAAFRAIERDFTRRSRSDCSRYRQSCRAIFVPVSALAGDNIVHRSKCDAVVQGPIAA
jgi:sulfate adenylyltransferase subunit 1